jgi:Flp pilus assembly protein TadG
MSARVPRLVTDTTGAALIEFALTLPLLLLILVGIFDFGFLFQKYQVVTNAAREGARMMILPGYTEANCQNRVSQYLTAGGVHETPSTTCQAQTITPAGASAFPVIRVTVTVTHTFKFLGPFSPSFVSVPLTAVSVMRVEVAGG